MTLEMNIFNICKQPGDDNELQEVDFTEKLVHDQFQTTSSEIKIDEADQGRPYERVVLPTTPLRLRL
jgi:hypothetical protein